MEQLRVREKLQSADAFPLRTPLVTWRHSGRTSSLVLLLLAMISTAGRSCSSTKLEAFGEQGGHTDVCLHHLHAMLRALAPSPPAVSAAFATGRVAGPRRCRRPPPGPGPRRWPPPRSARGRSAGGCPGPEGRWPPERAPCAWAISVRSHHTGPAGTPLRSRPGGGGWHPGLAC